MATFAVNNTTINKSKCVILVLVVQLILGHSKYIISHFLLLNACPSVVVN